MVARVRTASASVLTTPRAAAVSSNAQFRIAVKTSTIWGIVGVAIIVVLVIGIVLAFKKFGRR